MADNLPKHHPDAEMLLDYAAGKTPEAMSVLIATHLALCPGCRAEVRRFESLGGALIESTQPVALSEGALDAALARLDIDEPEQEAAAIAPETDAETARLVPQPLRQYLGKGLDGLSWKSNGGGIKEVILELGDPSLRTSLIRIAPGKSVPAHTHTGVETVLILKGAFSDSTGRYARGDVTSGTDELDHMPVADADEECICFAVVEGDLKFTGPLMRLLNPFLRI